VSATSPLSAENYDVDAICFRNWCHAITSKGGIVEQLDVTLVRGLKIWWSFAWRAMVLSILILIPVEAIVMVLMMRMMPVPGTTGLDPKQAMRMGSVMLVAWPILMAIIVVLQAQAMRWMLRRARWSGFKVLVLPQ